MLEEGEGKPKRKRNDKEIVTIEKTKKQKMIKNIKVTTKMKRNDKKKNL